MIKRIDKVAIEMGDIDNYDLEDYENEREACNIDGFQIGDYDAMRRAEEKEDLQYDVYKDRHYKEI